MTRPVKFGTVQPFLPAPLGGSAGQPDGAPPPVDCCEVDPTQAPDRATGDGPGRAFGLSAPHEPEFVQSKVNSNGGSPVSVTTTLDDAPTPGNLLIALWSGRSATVAGLSTTGGFPAGFTALDAFETQVFDGGASRLSYRFVQPGDGAAWSVTGATRQRLLIAEFSGPSAFDQQSNEINNAASSLVAANPITVAEAALIIGAFAIPTNGTNLLTPAATWIELDDGDVGAGSFGPLHQLIYKFLTGAGTATPADTTTTSGWGGIATSFDGINAAQAYSVPLPLTVDGDDTTYETIDGPDVELVDLGADYRIVRTRLRIATEFAGDRTYTIKGATLPDLSDEVLLATLTFTATGSFTPQDVEATWFTTDSYRYFHLEGDDELRRIHSWELYEPTLATSHQHAADGMTYDNGTSGLTGDTVQEAIDELDDRLDDLEAAAGSPVLDDNTDVTLTSPVAGDRLRFDGLVWRNDNRIWKPVMDGLGNVVTDSGTGEAIMTEVSP